MTFTGSTATGRRFLEYSAQPNMKEVCLEVGKNLRLLCSKRRPVLQKLQNTKPMQFFGTWVKIAQPIDQ